MYDILTLNKIAKCGTDCFDPAKYTCSDSAADPAAVMVRSAAMHDMELGGSLLAIARAGAGVNNIPIDRCSERGIAVFNTPGANANAVPTPYTGAGRSRARARMCRSSLKRERAPSRVRK